MDNNHFDAEFLSICEGFTESGAALLRKSYELAKKAHENQQRMSGEPYLVHSVEVAKILKEMKMDAVTIAAGFLHDVLEDTDYKVSDIKAAAGESVAFLVEGVSHVTAKVFRTKGQVFSEALKKMFLAMAKDIRVIIIKLADRLHNMRTIKYLPEDRRKVVAQETLSVYAPLAHRIGMARVKSELEDISFSVINPQAYREISNLIAEKKEERQKRVEVIKETIRRELEKSAIKCEIKGRPKHFYSIYNKMVRDNKPFEAIYDLLAVRIITDTPGNCYAILGMVHSMWKPVPGRFKDYIAMPKSNMYRSLHTTVLDSEGKPIEIQIRTSEMDRVAENGIAAHWSYKEDKEFDAKEDVAYTWMRQLLDWNSSNKENEDFLTDLKVDLFDEEVFVFTPKGEVKELVKGSTVLDFAYSVHSKLGDTCIGAKVNGKWVTIKYELKNGDRLEILTGPGQHPTLDWLKVVKTTKAKNRIRHWIKTNTNIAETVEKGRQLLSARLKRFNISLEAVPEEAVKKVLDLNTLKELDDLLAGIGSGEFSDVKIANILRRFAGEIAKPEQKTAPAEKRILKGEIVVQGEYSDIPYKFAKCCSPVPGDEIKGVVTRKGISIHRSNCENIDLNRISTPLVAVSWNESVSSYYTCRMKVQAKSRDGIVNDLVSTVTNNEAYLISVNTTGTGTAMLEVELAVRVKGQKHINDLTSSLKKVKGVAEIERAG